MPCRVLLAPSADLAREVLATRTVVLTVEAEYGSYVAEGRLHTAAHHQPVGSPYAGRHLVQGGRPSPCNSNLVPLLTEEDAAVGAVVLVSHVDLDTFGGCLRSMGAFQDLFPPKNVDAAALAKVPAEAAAAVTSIWNNVNFWDLAEYVDVRGAHKLGGSGAGERALRQLYAFWAWSKSPAGGPRLPRDQVTDVTDLVVSAGEVLRRIFHDDADLLAAGDAFRAAEDDLNRRTFLRREGDVVVRIAGLSRDFCNHLYTDPHGVPRRAVAALSRESGSVTISLADPVPGVSCRAIVQGLWGPEAGGHEGIAGSPREKDMGEAGLEDAVQALAKALA